MGLVVGKTDEIPHPPPSLPLEGGGAKRLKAFMRKALPFAAIKASRKAICYRIREMIHKGDEA
jgi:hypothetical protein